MADLQGTEEKKQEGLSAREVALIRELTHERMQKNEKLEYESFDGYELPPRTQFSMLKKPAVSVKYGKLTFNMACIRLFEGMRFILPIVNTNKKRLAIIPCQEEESASVEWARLKNGNTWVNKQITSVDFVEKLFDLMGWDRECRYKILGRIATSDRGLILIFDMEEAIMFAQKKETYTDPVTGEVKQRQVKYYPDAYKDRIGRSYNDYAQYRQMNLFEDFSGYQTDVQEPIEEGTSVLSDNNRAEAAPEQKISFEQQGDEW